MALLVGTSYYLNMMYRATQVYLRASKAVGALLEREEGASMVEYAFLIALIAVVAVAAVALFGTALSGNYDRIASSIPGG